MHTPVLGRMGPSRRGRFRYWRLLRNAMQLDGGMHDEGSRSKKRHTHELLAFYSGC